MKIGFICCKCNRIFNTEKECLEHEFLCKKNIAIKQIFIDEIRDGKLIVHINNYNNAEITSDNSYDLEPKKYHSAVLNNDEIKFDEINSTLDENKIMVFTCNYDMNHVKELIEKLINHVKELMENSISKNEHKIQEMKNDLEILKKMEYSIESKDY